MPRGGLSLTLIVPLWNVTDALPAPAASEIGMSEQAVDIVVELGGPKL